MCCQNSVGEHGITQSRFWYVGIVRGLCWGPMPMKRRMLPKQTLTGRLVVSSTSTYQSEVSYLLAQRLLAPNLSSHTQHVFQSSPWNHLLVSTHGGRSRESLPMRTLSGWTKVVSTAYKSLYHKRSETGEVSGLRSPVVIENDPQSMCLRIRIMARVDANI